MNCPENEAEHNSECVRIFQDIVFTEILLFVRISTPPDRPMMPIGFVVVTFSSGISLLCNSLVPADTQNIGDKK